MNEKSLEKNLANLERELVNLQTAHDVGLGAVGFYTYWANFLTVGMDGFQYGIVLIDVLDGERGDPLMDVYVSSIYGNNESGYAYAERVSGTKFDIYVMRPFYAQVIELQYKIVSSSRLNVRAATSYQEYVDWLNE